MKTPIKNIICCCSQGLGSSLILELSIKKTLKQMGRDDIKVQHCPISELFPSKFDLIIGGVDLERQLQRYPNVIIVKDFIHTEELFEKLSTLI